MGPRQWMFDFYSLPVERVPSSLIRSNPITQVPFHYGDINVAGTIEGKVVAISDDGSLITDIHVERLGNAPRDDRLRVRCDEHETCGIFPPDHGQPPFTLLAVEGDDGALQLVIVDDSAKIMLGIREGAAVEVVWD